MFPFNDPISAFYNLPFPLKHFTSVIRFKINEIPVEVEEGVVYEKQIYRITNNLAGNDFSERD